MFMQVSHLLSWCPYLHLISWIPSERLLIRFDIEIAINLALSINFNIEDIFFVTPSKFFSILVTLFSIGTAKVMYFSVFSPKQVNVF